MRHPIHEFAVDILLLIGLIMVMIYSVHDEQRIAELERTVIKMKQASEIE